MKIARNLTLLAVSLLLSLMGIATAQTWTPLKNKPPFSSPGTALLLTDGTVIVQDSEASDWWKLTPTNTANYVNGTWSQIASMPTGYGPLYYASAVLADGRVIVEGGEYNCCGGSEVTLGAIYDPVANKWTSVSPPSGFPDIGDAQSIVFPDGIFQIAEILNTEDAQLDLSTLTWTVLPGTGKQDRNSEEGWELLPNGNVLTVDALDAPNAEQFVQSTSTWISAGNTIVRLEDPGSQELGPAVLLPNATVFATGANASGAGHTSTYSVATNSWTPARIFRTDSTSPTAPLRYCPTATCWYRPALEFTRRPARSLSTTGPRSPRYRRPPTPATTRRTRAGSWCCPPDRCSGRTARPT